MKELLFLALLVHTTLSQTTSCEIQSKVYNITYKEPLVYFNVESLNYFQNTSGSTANLTYEISVLALNCSKSFSQSTYIGGGVKNFTAAVECSIISPLFDLNFTVEGRLQIGNSSYTSSSCTGNVAFKVIAAPAPAPAPNPDPIPIIESETSVALILGIVNLCTLIVLFLVGICTLVYLRVKGKKRETLLNN